jgi:hypothetical protein
MFAMLVNGNGHSTLDAMEASRVCIQDLFSLSLSALLPVPPPNFFCGGQSRFVRRVMNTLFGLVGKNIKDCELLRQVSNRIVTCNWIEPTLGRKSML